jgi:hypothetical protein
LQRIDGLQQLTPHGPYQRSQSAHQHHRQTHLQCADRQACNLQIASLLGSAKRQHQQGDEQQTRAEKETARCCNTCAPSLSHPRKPVRAGFPCRTVQPCARPSRNEA